MSHPVFHIEIELEADGRYIAEVVELPGVMAYGDTKARAIDAVKALAFRVLADQVEHGEMSVDGCDFSTAA